MGTLDKEEIWATTLDIDNPLFPWTELYKKELDLKEASKLDQRPPLAAIQDSFQSAQKVAVSGSLVLTGVFIVVWPAVTCLAGVFSLAQFYIWVMLSVIWGLLAGIFITVVPVWSEIKSSAQAYSVRKTVHPANTCTTPC